MLQLEEVQGIFEFEDIGSPDGPRAKLHMPAVPEVGSRYTVNLYTSSYMYTVQFCSSGASLLQTGHLYVRLLLLNILVIRVHKTFVSI